MFVFTDSVFPCCCYGDMEMKSVLQLFITCSYRPLADYDVQRVLSLMNIGKLYCVQTGSWWYWYQRCRSCTPGVFSPWTRFAANHSRQLQLFPRGWQRITHRVWFPDDGEAGGRTVHLGTTSTPLPGQCGLLCLLFLTQPLVQKLSWHL